MLGTGKVVLLVYVVEAFLGSPFADLATRQDHLALLGGGGVARRKVVDAEKRVQQVRAVVVEAEQSLEVGEFLQGVDQGQVSGVWERARPRNYGRRGESVCTHDAGARLDAVEEVGAGGLVHLQALSLTGAVSGTCKDQQRRASDEKKRSEHRRTRKGGGLVLWCPYRTVL